jgi:5-methylcytosine-specific restriction endonuclease McrA
MARSSSRRMKQLTQEFFLEGRRLDAKKDPAANCWMCKQTIDYSVDPHTTPDSHNLDHYHSVSEHPELQEDPTNFRHSHMLCNNQRSNNAPTLGLGEAVPDWW